jgi:preprotein translocase subunit YajC
MFWLLALVQEVAHAQTAAAPAAEQPSALMSLVPFIFIFAVMYFLVIRPQGKRQRQQAQFLSALKHGDEVITSSGILGRIEGLTEQFATLEIGNGVRVKILRSAIGSSAKSVTEKPKDK